MKGAGLISTLIYTLISAFPEAVLYTTNLRCLDSKHPTAPSHLHSSSSAPRSANFHTQQTAEGTTPAILTSSHIFTPASWDLVTTTSTKTTARLGSAEKISKFLLARVEFKFMHPLCVNFN
jgi:hypothetical protein